MSKQKTNDLSERQDEIYAVKGFLIMLIVLGHNYLLKADIPHMGTLLYSFHVSCFFLLTFIFPTQKFNFYIIRDKFVKYLVPYTWFYLISCFFYIIFIDPDFQEGTHINSVIKGLFIGSAFLLKISSGFQLYWFLPALFSLILIRSFFASNIVIAFIILIFAIIIHFIVGDLEQYVKEYSPMGVLISLYIFPLGLLIQYLFSKYNFFSINIFTSFSITILCVCLFLMVAINSKVNLATLMLYSYKDIKIIALHDMIIISSFIVICLLSVLFKKINAIVMFGKYSLEIFLMHSLVFRGTVLIINKTWLSSYIVECSTISGFILFFYTIFISYKLSVYMKKSSIIQKYIFPKSYNDLFSQHRS